MDTRAFAEKCIARIFCSACTLMLLFSASAHAAMTAQQSLAKCQKTLSGEGQKYLKARVAAMSGCLQKISDEFVKKGQPTATGAIGVCIGKARLLNDSRSIGKSLEEKFRAKVTPVCDPDLASVPHTWAQMYGGSSPDELNFNKIETLCSLAYSIPLTSWANYLQCHRNLTDAVAVAATASAYPGALVLLTPAFIAEVAATPAPAGDASKSTDAATALDALRISLMGTVAP
jgi:hypothetical protein